MDSARCWFAHRSGRVDLLVLDDDLVRHASRVVGVAQHGRVAQLVNVVGLPFQAGQIGLVGGCPGVDGDDDRPLVIR